MSALVYDYSLAFCCLWKCNHASTEWRTSGWRSRHDLIWATPFFDPRPMLSLYVTGSLFSTSLSTGQAVLKSTVAITGLARNILHRSCVSLPCAAVVVVGAMLVTWPEGGVNNTMIMLKIIMIKMRLKLSQSTPTYIHTLAALLSNGFHVVELAEIFLGVLVCHR